MMSEIVEKIFEVVPKDGRYEQDIMFGLVHQFSQRDIEAALRWLCHNGHLRKCGNKSRPLYVRVTSPRVFYDNIRPVAGDPTPALLQMHSNFEEKPR